MKKNNFYVLAVGRSGTTLLQSILDCHSNIAMPPESFFMLHLYTKYKNETNWSQVTIENFIDDVFTDRPFRIRWEVSRNELLQAFEKEKPITNFEDACNAVRLSYKKAFDKKNSTTIGDKHPIYGHIIPRILKVHPLAKIIFMVRDPRGSGNGQIKTFGKKDALFVGHSWAKQNERILQIKDYNPDNFYILKYEDLISDTPNTIKTLCDFLEIPFEEDMLNYREKTVNQYSNYSEALREKHQNLLKPIDKKIAEKWKTSLTQEQRKQIEYTTHTTAQKLGYNFEKPSLSITEKIKLPTAKCKELLIYFIVNTYFNLPFSVRKFILSVRSSLWDKKYKTD